MVGDTIRELLLPERFRKYVTFRWATVFVLFLALWNLVFRLFTKPEYPPGVADRISAYEHQFHTLPFLLKFNIVLALGFWLIYTSRQKTKYYTVRVILYTLLLGSLLSEIIVLTVSAVR